MGVYKHLSVNIRVNECMKCVVTFRFVYLKIIIVCVRNENVLPLPLRFHYYMSVYVENSFKKSKLYKESKEI